MKRTALGLHKTAVHTTDAGTQTTPENKRHQESTLDPIRSDWQIFRGPQPYTHASLAAIYENKYDEGTSRYSRDHVVRMTSPRQPFKNMTYFDSNIGGGVQSIGQQGDGAEPAYCTYWDFYASMYKYYSVLACRYHITYENLSADKQYVHIMNFNATEPPKNCSNHDMLLWQGVTSYLSTPHAAFYNSQQLRASEHAGMQIENDAPSGAATNADINSDWALSRTRAKPVILHSAQYEAGETQQEIVLDENVSTWTATTANPQLEENLLIRVKSYDDATAIWTGNESDYGRLLAYNLKVHIEYLVEFRELKDGLRWPVQRDPITLTIQANNYPAA